MVTVEFVYEYLECHSCPRNVTSCLQHITILPLCRDVSACLWLAYASVFDHDNITITWT